VDSSFFPAILRFRLIYGKPKEVLEIDYWEGESILANMDILDVRVESSAIGIVLASFGQHYDLSLYLSSAFTT